MYLQAIIDQKTATLVARARIIVVMFLLCFGTAERGIAQAPIDVVRPPIDVVRPRRGSGT